MLRIVARELDACCHVHEVVAHKYHVGTFDGNVGARADGNAYISARKRRSVVYAITHHGDFTVACQQLNLSIFTVGKHAGNHLVDTHLLLDGCSRALVIASQHDRAHAKRFHLTHCLFACGFHLICNSYHAKQLTTPCEEQRRFALLSHLFGFRLESTKLDTRFSHHGRIATERFGAFGRARQAPARDLAEVLDRELVAFCSLA